MLLFGHVGLTLGAGYLASKLINSKGKHFPFLLRLTGSSPAALSHTGSYSALREEIIQIASLTVGSMLPDIIDKPVGNLFFSQTFGHNGRIFCHTLLFALLVLFSAIIYYRWKGKNWFLLLSSGVFMHLILDFMWSSPETLFWPLLGTSFPRLQFTNYMGELWHNLVNSPLLIASETVGLAITILFFWRLGHEWLSTRNATDQKHQLQ